jgi:beta-1,4-N-acetylglucosaminyltransferase
MEKHSVPGKKLCFVTIGATASFNPLIAATLAPSFLKSLASAGYTHLLLQYGKEGQKIFQERAVDDANAEDVGISIDGFDFKQEGLEECMKAAKGGNSAEEGVVISHAGK